MPSETEIVREADIRAPMRDGAALRAPNSRDRRTASDHVISGPTFEGAYALALRISIYHASRVIRSCGLPRDFRDDLTLEALLRCWRRFGAFEASRGPLGAYLDLIVTSEMTSMMRSMHSQRSGQFRKDPLEYVLGLAAPHDGADLRTDVKRVLAGVSPLDRRVAGFLTYYSATETSRSLGVSRAKVYRAIGRLRVAFTAAGFAGRRGRPLPAYRSNCDSRIGGPQEACA